MGLVMKNLAAFEHFRERIANVVPDLLPVVAKRIGVAFVKQVADEFRQSRDPYGNAWAPVSRNRRRDVRARAARAKAGKPPKTDKPLIDTGRLRGSVAATTEGTEVRVALPVEYASYHQYGTRRIKRRQILPEANTGGLPSSWVAAATSESVLALAAHFKKGG
jgi:phage gpG-like protein